MMRKKTVSMLLATVLCAVPLAACGGGSDNPGKQGESAAKEEAPKLEPAELVFYDGSGDWPAERFDREIGGPLKQKFPHITPKFVPYTNGSKVQDMITAGEPPDIVFASTGLVYSRLMQYELQYDITPLIQKYKYDMGKQEPVVTEQMKQLANGGIYGLPAFMSPATLYYNKDIFDKFGVAYPKDGNTWDELYEMSKKLTRKDGGITYRGLFVSAQHLIRLNQFSLKTLDTATNKATFADDSWKKFYDNAARFFTVPDFELTTALTSVANQRSAFIKDRTVAMWLPVSTQHTAEELAGMNWDVASFPVFADKPGVGPQPYPNVFWLTRTSKYKDQAFQAMAYLASEEFQLAGVKRGEFLSALKSDTLRKAFGQDAAMYKGKNIKAMLPEKFASATPIGKYNSIAETNLLTSFNNVILGKKDTNTALREAEEAANKKIQEELSK
ncbi:extracellular solute-binding protein [Paenibacillus hemerocallicola]|uniref:Extracellular solute-binding protein n=1 Tax=Paenibacillus hemerocallicola TaxID=1172614 RepID=A0A5C4T8L7_9BACL|nr:extracellular solute-binding protein [Paenibacillus hemerocallicola]TNJ65424.1 extracellular solute-binding protein [Paenibacillus hemerocallicola]